MLRSNLIEPYTKRDYCFGCSPEWLDVAKFKQQSNTLHQVSEDVSQLKHELRAGRQDDINRIDSYLQQLGTKILTNVNATMSQMSSQVAALVSS